MVCSDFLFASIFLWLEFCMRTELTVDVPDRPLGLVHGMSWSVLGQTVSALSQWGILVVLVKHLDAESVGQFAIALSVAAPIYAFANLQLSGLLASDQTREYSPAAYLTLRFISSLAAYLVLIVLLIAGVFGSELDEVLLLVGLLKLCEAVSDLMFGFLQQRERTDKVGLLLVIRSVVGLPIVWATVAYTRQVHVVLAALLVAQILLTSCVDLKILRRYAHDVFEFVSIRAWRASLSSSRHLMVVALPMGIVVGLNMLNFNIPRYWLAYHQGTAAVGVYAALSYITTAGNMVIGSMGQAAVPRLSRYYQSDRRKFRQLLMRVALPAILAGAAGIGIAAQAGAPLLQILYSSSFSAYTTTFVWVMVASAILYIVSITGCCLSAVRLYRAQAWITAASTVSTAVACHYLIPLYGLTGAALAMVAGFAVKLSGNLAVLRYAVQR
jgi:O-antigen/teichoic acid export membrane protein